MFTNFIIKIKNFFIKKKLPLALGRWNVNHTYNQKTTKIDWSNHDHCGPCGHIKIKKPN